MSGRDANTWFILGAGSMGRLWASTLNLYKSDAALILREDKRARAGTYSLSSDKRNKKLAFQQGPTSDAEIITLSVPCCTTSTLEQGSISKLIIATKSYDAVEALLGALPKLAEQAVVVLLGNGLGYQQAIADHLAEHLTCFSLFCAISSDGAMPKLTAQPVDTHCDFAVTRTGIGFTQIGLLKRSDPFDAADLTMLELINKLNIGGLNASLDEHIIEALWRKFFINCAINGLTVVHQCSNGELLSNGEYHENFSRLAHELDKLAEILDFSKLSATRMGTSSVESANNYRESVYQAASAVARATSANHSSMLQDFHAARRNELDALNGYCALLLENFGLDATENRELISRIDSLYSTIR